MIIIPVRSETAAATPGNSHLIADAASFTGTGHSDKGQTCQDSVRQHSNGTTALAVVSDGVSSAGNSRFGSEIIAGSTLAAMQTLFTADTTAAEMGSITAQVFDAQLAALLANMAYGLDKGRMATAGCGFLNQQFGGATFWGDGGVMFVFKDGSTQCYRLKSDVPFCPGYAIVWDEESSTWVIQKTPNLNGNLIVEDGNGQVIGTYPARDVFDGIMFIAEDGSTIEAVFVYTDGFEEVREGTKKLPWHHVMMELRPEKTGRNAITNHFRTIFALPTEPTGLLSRRKSSKSWLQNRHPGDDVSLAGVMTGTAPVSWS